MKIKSLAEIAEDEKREKDARKKLKLEQRERMVKAFEKMEEHLKTIARYYDKQTNQGYTSDGYRY